MGRMITASVYCLFVASVVAALYGITAAHVAITDSLIKAILEHRAPMELARADTTPRVAAAAAAVTQATPLRPEAPLSPATNPCVPLGTRDALAAAQANDAHVAFATFANSAQADFALNWLEHLRRVNLHRSALIGATDAGAERVLGARVTETGARCFQLASAIGGEEAKWGSPGFAQMGRTKAAFVASFLRHNVTLLFADADVVFLRDPLPFVAAARRLGADLLFHTDGFAPSDAAVASGGLEAPAHGWGPELNTGLFLMTPACTTLAQRWVDALRSDDAFANWKNDQQVRRSEPALASALSAGPDTRPTQLRVATRRPQALNQLAAKGVARSSLGDGAEPMRVFGGALRLGLLPT